MNETPDALPVWLPDLQQFEKACLAGLNRSQFVVPEILKGKGDAQAVSALLSILAVQLKLSQVSEPLPELLPFKDEQSHASAEPARRYLSPVANRSLCLWVARNANERSRCAELRILFELHQHGFSLHPFHYVKLQDLIELVSELPQQQGYLDTQAWHWVNADQTQQQHIDEDINVENWAEFPQASRKVFLRQWRLQDACAAREALSEMIAPEPAAVRVALLETLLVNLSDKDEPFLRAMAADRAASVVKQATELLQGIANTPEFELRKQDVLDRLRLSKGGAIKKPTLGIDAPSKMTNQSFMRWLMPLFECLTLQDILKQLQLDEKSLVSALRKSRVVPALLCLLAKEERYDLIRGIAMAHGSETLEAISQLRTEHMDELSIAQRMAFFDASVQLDKLATEKHPMAFLHSLMTVFYTPLTHQQSMAVVQHKFYKKWLKTISGSAGEKQAKPQSVSDQLRDTYAVLHGDACAELLNSVSDLPLSMTHAVTDFAKLLHTIQTDTGQTGG